jgi:hypothetical protein
MSSFTEFIEKIINVYNTNEYSMKTYFILGITQVDIFSCKLGQA